ncbi:MAG: putative calcium/sodium:proton antiporter [bacterium ADurb.Bin478]|jgi:cation:H+ antiporter|nr:MAG: putative calcium/sodium:proton antiporter [bacterium ADurb.Bin478]
MTVALFIFSLILLWGGSEAVTRNITPLAKAFGVRELIVTILGVSVLSSLPELTVSTFAILQGAGDVAVGNVIQKELP